MYCIFFGAHQRQGCQNIIHSTKKMYVNGYKNVFEILYVFLLIYFKGFIIFCGFKKIFF